MGSEANVARQDTPMRIPAVHTLLAFFLVLSSVSGVLHADVRMPALFTDSMVVQRDAVIPVWGTATPGEEITVSFHGQQVVTKARDSGRWQIELAPISKVGGSHTMRIRGRNEIKIEDVVVGDVWICSGQSNMQWSVTQAMNAKKEIAAAKFPKIRLFSVPHVATPEPADDVKAKWLRCSPATVKDFSAVGYYFGRALHANLHSGLSRVPIGLIDSSWGGTPVEAWMPAKLLVGNEITDPILSRWEKVLAEWPERKKAYDDKLAAWKKARNAGASAGRRPRGPQGPNHQHRPGNLWNGMIHPLLPFAMRGAIWYQGESNSARAEQYGTLFPMMIEHWREAWGKEFPFYWVQLANYKDRRDPRNWAELREAQTMTLRLPSTGQALAIDIGMSNNIHPTNKQEVGRRLALLARSRCYGEKNIDDAGPTYVKHERVGSTLVLEFANAENGLVLRKPNDKKPAAFEIAAGDADFVAATANIIDGKLHVRAEGVAEPTDVRYAWRHDPNAILFDKSGLPAVPFRTDDRPRATRWKY